MPVNYKLRDVQIEALCALEKDWRHYDVFVLNLPVATGKSLCAKVISEWVRKFLNKQSTIITPNNLLVDQYIASFPALPVMHGSKRYKCKTTGTDVGTRKETLGALCDFRAGCNGCNSYRADLAAVRSVPYLVCNYYTYLAHKLQTRTRVLIADESHNLVSTMQDISSHKIWRHKLPPEHRYPTPLRDLQQLYDWVQSLPEELVEESTAITHLRKTLDGAYENYLYKICEDEYRGELRECLKVQPVDVRDEPQVFFAAAEKIILMSATFSHKDIEQLGLYTKKIRYIEADSPIPATQRPVVVLRSGLALSFAKKNEQLPKLAELIKEIISKHPNEKGLIHLPYSMALAMKSLLFDADRLMWHDKDTKQQVYEAFRQTTEPKVLVASGMYEGIDLPYDAGRFQFVGKIPFPSLGDAAIKHKAEKDPEWYAWETIKVVLQACGRICRGPDDYGITYIGDKNFNKLFLEAPGKQFFPGWFRNSVKWV